MRNAAQAAHGFHQFRLRHVAPEVPSGHQFAALLEARRFNAAIEARHPIARGELPISSGHGDAERAGGAKRARRRLGHRQAERFASQHGRFAVATNLHPMPARRRDRRVDPQRMVAAAQNELAAFDGEREPARPARDGLPLPQRRGRHHGA